MKKEKLKEIILPAIFYGSLWGIAEAVLGYLLHLLPFAISGFVMFPIGFYFMYKGYRKTQNTGTIFVIGIIASAVKLIDLFIPHLPVIRTVNPAVSILIQSLTAMVAIRLFCKDGKSLSFKGALFASITWRALFIFHALILTLFLIPSGIIEGGYRSILEFIFLEGIINVVIIYSLTKIYASKLNTYSTRYRIKPLMTAFAFAIALTSTIVFSVL